MAARINGPHACGHPSKYLPDSIAARAMIAEWAFEDCVPCVRMARDIAAAQMAREMGLPDLIGSDKQVQWARSVREDARAQLCTYTETHATPEVLAAAEMVLYWQDAGWWIDRDKSGEVYPEKLIAWVAPLVTVALGYKGA